MRSQIVLAILSAITLVLSHSCWAEQTVLFSDSFSADSRGERNANPVSAPPPKGMGYTTNTPFGYQLKNWIVRDAEPDGPRRSFWCVPEAADGAVAEVMEQAGRSRNSIAYARTIIPQQLTQFTIEFRQRANDNDYIGFVIGATQPQMMHDGFEFGYQRQLPGTDETTDDVYYQGDLGEGKVEGQAHFRRWVSHRIEVDAQTVRWFQDDKLTLEGKTEKRLAGGYFGIRQKYERGTRYDDVRITTQQKLAVDRPNVLFIAVDDLRCDLGCYGVDQVVSPELDRLAERSVFFSYAYCQYPFCNPSRTSVMTGLRPDATGMDRDEIQNRYHFREKLPRVETLPQLFQRYGYRVGRVGKIYHYGVPREIGTESALDDRPSWQFSLYPRGGERDEEAELISYTPQRSSGWAVSWQVSKTPANKHTDALVADQAIDQLRQLREEPFFLAVGFYRPHVPSTAPAECFDPYPLDETLLPDEPPQHLAELPDAVSNPVMRVDVEPENLRRFKRAYYATITLVDQQIGRLVASLEELGLSENTIIVLWSDHGYLLGEHGLWMKPYLFEETVRSPLMIYDPRHKSAAAECNQIVELLDIYPTLADLCGLEQPTHLHGKSLAKLIADPSSVTASEAFSQVRSRHATGYSIRTPRWRYTEWDGGTAGRELYDHSQDSSEHHNLADSPELQPVIKQLSEKLNAFANSSGQ